MLKCPTSSFVSSTATPFSIRFRGVPQNQFGIPLTKFDFQKLDKIKNRSFTTFTNLNPRFPTSSHRWGKEFGVSVISINIITQNTKLEKSPFYLKSSRSKKYLRDGRYESPYETGKAPFLVDVMWRRKKHTFDYIQNVDPKVMLWVLIGLNVLVFLLWHTIGTTPEGRKMMVQHFMASWTNIYYFRPWTLITSCFSQRELLHLVINMLVLSFIGPELMYILGVGRFFVIYMGGGLTSSLVHILYERKIAPLLHRVPARYYREHPAHGASGAINSILVSYGLIYPSRIFYLYFVIPVPALLLVAGIVGWDLYSAISASPGEVAHAGHLGGALFGFLFYMYIRKRLWVKYP